MRCFALIEAVDGSIILTEQDGQYEPHLHEKHEGPRLAIQELLAGLSKAHAIGNYSPIYTIVTLT